MYGNCASCEFPILVKDHRAIDCPFCHISNTPINESGFSPWIIGVLVVGSILNTLEG